MHTTPRGRILTPFSVGESSSPGRPRVVLSLEVMEARNAPGDLRAAFDPLSALRDDTAAASAVAEPVADAAVSAAAVESVRLDLDLKFDMGADDNAAVVFAPISVTAPPPRNPIDLESDATPAGANLPGTGALGQLRIGVNDDGTVGITDKDIPPQPTPPDSEPEASDPTPGDPDTPTDPVPTPTDPNQPGDPDAPDDDPGAPDDWDSPTDPSQPTDPGDPGTNPPSNNDPGPPVVREYVIGDRVWEDENENGSQDGGEPGIANIAVLRYDITGSVRGSTVTDRDGHYEFHRTSDGTERLAVRVKLDYWMATVKDKPGVSEEMDSDINAHG